MGLLLATAACTGSSSGEPDESLGGLVVKRRTPPQVIDVDLATTDSAHLLRAAHLPYERVAEVLGSHRVHITSTTTVYEGARAADSQPLEELTVETRIAYDGADEFHAVVENSKDYGREVVFTGGHLYLAPRYGLFHRRPPNDPAEPPQLLAELFAELPAHLDLLGPSLQVASDGPLEHAGRKAHKVNISLSSSPRPRTPAKLDQRAWRDSIEVTRVEGELILDREIGVVLSASIEGEFTATTQRGDQPRLLTTAFTLRHAISDIGRTAGIAAPPEDRWMDTPRRLEEVAERNELLRGIAPQVRKSADPTGANMNPAPAVAPTKTEDSTGDTDE